MDQPCFRSKGKKEKTRLGKLSTCDCVLKGRDDPYVAGSKNEIEKEKVVRRAQLDDEIRCRDMFDTRRLLRVTHDVSSAMQPSATFCYLNIDLECAPCMTNYVNNVLHVTASCVEDATTGRIWFEVCKYSQICFECTVQVWLLQE